MAGSGHTVAMMLLRYRMLVIDLDGTLLDRRGGISPRNRAAVHDAAQAGLRIVVATGRAWIEARSALEQIGHEGWAITAGGAILCDSATGRTVERSVMPQALSHAIAASLLHHGHRALLLKDRHAVGYDYLAVGSANLDPALQWWFQSLPVQVRYAGGLHEDEHPHESVRVGAVARGEELGRIATELRNDLGERVLIQSWSAVTQSEATGSGTHLLEAFNPKVSKWTMAQICCRQLGFEPQQVAAIGDEINDLDLIRNAGLGIAMANANQQVREAAGRVTGHHAEDGVATAIEQILSGRW